MRVEIKDAKVELDVLHSHLIINGETLPLPREVGIRLVFGKGVEPKPKESVEAVEKVVEVKTKAAKKGCQSPASRKKLSLALRKHHAKKRREGRKSEKVPKPGLKKTKRHMNGSGQIGLFN